jgi:hypothetical protein
MTGLLVMGLVGLVVQVSWTSYKAFMRSDVAAHDTRHYREQSIRILCDQQLMLHRMYELVYEQLKFVRQIVTSADLCPSREKFVVATASAFDAYNHYDPSLEDADFRAWLARKVEQWNGLRAPVVSAKSSSDFEDADDRYYTPEPRPERQQSRPDTQRRLLMDLSLRDTSSPLHRLSDDKRPQKASGIDPAGNDATTEAFRIPSSELVEALSNIDARLRLLEDESVSVALFSATPHSKDNADARAAQKAERDARKKKERALQRLRQREHANALGLDPPTSETSDEDEDDNEDETTADADARIPCARYLDILDVQVAHVRASLRSIVKGDGHCKSGHVFSRHYQTLLKAQQRFNLDLVPSVDAAGDALSDSDRPTLQGALEGFREALTKMPTDADTEGASLDKINGFKANSVADKAINIFGWICMWDLRTYIKEQNSLDGTTQDFRVFGLDTGLTQAYAAMHAVSLGIAVLDYNLEVRANERIAGMVLDEQESVCSQISSMLLDAAAMDNVMHQLTKLTRTLLRGRGGRSAFGLVYGMADIQDTHGLRLDPGVAMATSRESGADAGRIDPNMPKTFGDAEAGPTPRPTAGTRLPEHPKEEMFYYSLMDPDAHREIVQGYMDPDIAREDDDLQTVLAILKDPLFNKRSLELVLRTRANKYLIDGILDLVDAKSSNFVAALEKQMASFKCDMLRFQDEVSFRRALSDKVVLRTSSANELLASFEAAEELTDQVQGKHAEQRVTEWRNRLKIATHQQDAALAASAEKRLMEAEKEVRMAANEGATGDNSPTTTDTSITPTSSGVCSVQVFLFETVLLTARARRVLDCDELKNVCTFLSHGYREHLERNKTTGDIADKAVERMYRRCKDGVLRGRLFSRNEKCMHKTDDSINRERIQASLVHHETLTDAASRNAFADHLMSYEVEVDCLGDARNSNEASLSAVAGVVDTLPSGASVRECIARAKRDGKTYIETEAVKEAMERLEDDGRGVFSVFPALMVARFSKILGPTWVDDTWRKGLKFEDEIDELKLQARTNEEFAKRIRKEPIFAFVRPVQNPESGRDQPTQEDAETGISPRTSPASSKIEKITVNGCIGEAHLVELLEGWGEKLNSAHEFFYDAMTVIAFTPKEKLAKLLKPPSTRFGDTAHHRVKYKYYPEDERTTIKGQD